jgi:hypothetical protein
MSDMTPDEFWAILHSMPEPKPVFYRLYYNKDGTPIIYTMEDLPGNYIEVDCETYTLASFNVQVVDNKLVHIKTVSTVTKLQPGDTGTPCSPGDICIVVSEAEPHVKWNQVTNETD